MEQLCFEWRGGLAKGGIVVNFLASFIFQREQESEKFPVFDPFIGLDHSLPSDGNGVEMESGPICHWGTSDRLLISE